MAIPKEAIREAIEGNVVIYDVSHLLREKAIKLKEKREEAGKKPKLPFGKRDPRLITTAIVHKSGANGPGGFDGCVSTMSFVVFHRGWDGAAYTFWISRKPDKDEEGRIVVYRMQPDNVKSWHTGGRLNRVGVGLGVQGNYDSQWDLLSNGIPRIEKNPTIEQWEALEAMLLYLQKRYGIDFGKKDEKGVYGLTGHWEHGKIVCPGDALRYWVIKRREQHIDKLEKIEKKVLEGEINAYNFKPKEFQVALYLVGFDPGPIDGIIGSNTRGALEAFQESCGLTVDGWYGHETAREIQESLRLIGCVQIEKFYSQLKRLEQVKQ